MSSSSRKWNVAIKVINDDWNIEQIKGGKEIMSRNQPQLDSPRPEHCMRCQATSLTQHLPNLNEVASSSPGDEVDKLDLVAEENPIRSKHSETFPLKGVRMQRRRKLICKRHSKTALHKQNNYSNLETLTAERTGESKMLMEYKKESNIFVTSPTEQDHVNKSSDRHETSSEPHSVKASPAKMMANEVTNVQPAGKLPADTDTKLKRKPHVQIQEIRESSAILEILSSFSFNLNSCEPSQDTDLRNKYPKSLLTQDSNNLIGVETQCKIHPNNVNQLCVVGNNSNMTPTESSSSINFTTRIASKVSPVKAANSETTQTPLKISKLDVSCGRTSSGALLKQHLQHSKGKTLLSTDIELLSKSRSVNDNCMKNKTSLPNIKKLTVNCEPLMINDLESSAPSQAVFTPQRKSFSLVAKQKSVSLTWRKTRSFLRKKKTSGTGRVLTDVQKSGVVKKTQYRPVLTKKCRPNLSRKSNAVLTKFRPDLTNAALTEKSDAHLTGCSDALKKGFSPPVVKKSTLDLMKKSSPVLIKRFRSHLGKKLALRKKLRSYVQTNTQPNTNNTSSPQEDRKMREDVITSPENLTDEADKAQHGSSHLTARSPTFALAAEHSQQKSELTDTNIKSHDNYGFTKRNYVIIPPSEHISFTKCSDVKFSNTIMKSISKLAKSSSNQIYVYLDKSTRPTNFSQDQMIFRVDSSTFPYKFIKTSFSDELTTNEKSLLQFSSKELPKRQAQLRNSQKRQPATNFRFPFEHSDSESANTEHLPKDKLVLYADLPVMSLHSDGEMIFSSSCSRSISQWTCENVSRWLTSHGLGRFTKEFAGVSGCGLVELSQYFNKDMKILQTYLHDLGFSFSEKLKLYAALRALPKQNIPQTPSTSLAGNSSLTDHTSPVQGKATPTLQRSTQTPISASSKSRWTPLDGDGRGTSSSPVSQWTCEDVCRWLITHGLSRFTKDFSHVDGHCLVELIISCSTANNSIYIALYNMGFTLSELLNFSALLRALSQQPSLE